MKTKPSILLSTATLALCGMMLFATNGMAAEKDTLNATDIKFIKNTAAANTAEVKLAELGGQKAMSMYIKEFAKTLVADHTKANEELAKLATAKKVELSAVIDPADAATFQKLEKENVAEFDKAFIAELTSLHKKSVSNFEEASKDAKDSDLKAWVDKMLPTLKAHLEKAKELAPK